MSRWRQFFNKTHVESGASFHGETSLKYALTSRGIPMVRLLDEELQYLEVPHRVEKCVYQEAQRSLDRNVHLRRIQKRV